MILAAVAAAAALTLTACGGSGSGSGSGSGPDDSPAGPTGTASSPGHPRSDGGGTGSQGGGGTEAGGAPASSDPAKGQAADDSRCAAGNLGLKLGRGDPGAGNVYYTLTFTNKGSSTCALNGFPGVSMQKGDGSTIGKPADREGDAGPAVTLAPGGTAHVNLHTANEGVTDGGCWAQPSQLKVYPPGSKQSLTTSPGTLKVCGDMFTVTTVASGSH